VQTLQAPTPHHSIFTGQTIFLAPNQQCQSTESKFKQLVYKYPHDHQPANKAYFSDITAANISKSYPPQDGGENQSA